MPASTALQYDLDIESFMTEYYAAWGGTDEDRIMSYYAENVTVQMPGALMHGKSAVREQFVHPFITGFPGNRHVVKNMIVGRDVVVVEFSFNAEHRGLFAGHAPTDAHVEIGGCGVYHYASAERQITAARIYFDMPALLKQITDPSYPRLGPEEAASEKALHESESRFRDYAQTASDWFWEIGPDYRFTLLTENAFGSDPAHRIGTACWDHALDLETEPEKWRLVRETLDSRKPFRDFVYCTAGRDGSPMYVKASGKPVFDDDGKFRGYRGTGTDVTAIIQAQEALRESERGLRSALDGIPGLVAILGPEGGVEVVNRQIVDYCGQSLEDLRNWGTNGTVHPEDLPNVAEAFSRAIASGTPYQIEVRLRRFDGEYRWFDNHGVPFRDASGRVLRFYVLLTDINERKRAEEAVRASEKNFKLIIDTIPALVWSACPDGTTEFFNQHYLDYVGLSQSQAENWGWTSAVHPEDLIALADTWQAILASGQPGEAEARLRRSNGEYRWFLFRTSPFHDEQGKIVKWYGINTDIEDRKRAEEALQSNERNLNLIINTIPAHLYVLNTEGFVQYLSQAVMDYTGLTLQDVPQEDYRDRVIHPEDLKTVLAVRAASLKLGLPFTTEQRVLNKDGQYRWFLVRYKPLLDEQGGIVRWYVAASDIEDRKRAEHALLAREAELRRANQYLASAQELSKTGSYTHDLMTGEQSLSDQMYRIWEFDPAKNVTHQMVLNRIHPEDRPTFEAAQNTALKAGEDFSLAYRIVTDSGAVKYFRTVSRRLTEITGRFVYIGATQDVTESKAAEEALHVARAELAHVGRVMTLGALTASIAHEVNQPLAGIVTNANTCLRMLAADPPNLEGARVTVQRTLRDGNRASEIIQRLRAMFTHKERTAERVDLNEVTREVLALSTSELQRSGVILRTELREGLPAIAGDRVQLQQVILNLVLNAADAMRSVDGRPRNLMIATNHDDADRIRLSVRDSGIGIDPQKSAKLFEAFYTTKSHGMGVGLSISRSIIESHEGRIWAVNNDGPGATFSFSIPVSQH